MTHLTQTLFGYVSTFTRFKLADGSGPFVKVGGQTYQDSDGNLIAIVPAEPVFQVPDEYKNIGSGGGGGGFPVGATHYWALNEASGTRSDSIGGLALSPADIDPSQIPGPLDFAVSVNGSVADVVSLISSAIPSIRAGGEWSINFWYNATTATADDSIAQGSNDGTFDFVVDLYPGVDQSSLVLRDGIGGNTSSDFTAPIDGSWHSITIRFSSGQLDFFIDGVFVISRMNAVGPNSVNKSLNVGANYATGSVDSAIGISDYGVWNRALTDQEITTLYNGGTPLRP